MAPRFATHERVPVSWKPMYTTTVFDPFRFPLTCLATRTMPRLIELGTSRHSFCRTSRAHPCRQRRDRSLVLGYSYRMARSYVS